VIKAWCETCWKNPLSNTGDFRNLFLKISQLCCFVSQKFFVWVALDFYFLCCQVMKMQPKDNTDHVPCCSSFLPLYTYIEFLFVVWGNRIGVFLALGLVCSSEDPETHNAVTPKTVIILIWVSQHCDVVFWELKLWSSKSGTHSSKLKTSITDTESTYDRIIGGETERV